MCVQTVATDVSVKYRDRLMVDLVVVACKPRVYWTLIDFIRPDSCLKHHLYEDAQECILVCSSLRTLKSQSDAL